MLEFKIRGQDEKREVLECWLKKDDDGNVTFWTSPNKIAYCVFSLRKEGVVRLGRNLLDNIGLQIENGRIIAI